MSKVPWYRERTVMNTTLGSLLTVVLLRTAQLNLAKMRVCGCLSGLASPVCYAESCMHGSSFQCVRACRAKPTVSDLSRQLTNGARVTRCNHAYLTCVRMRHALGRMPTCRRTRWRH